ncbi:hypothetical protein [Acinetobacter beijerinckii]|uniref:Uncharacterized protein n=1 Tax=Acinetobacter beijerinckii CIP 110307 TaxID=1217648 RepID=N9DYG6_9GAMM|nr:hypothetical protein [Acinetobacter beijerinckii]ENW02962.1 hypothetical protein F933_03368 [Acinetobacter beijerinckii CIP 110307]
MISFLNFMYESSLYSTFVLFLLMLLLTSLVLLLLKKPLNFAFSFALPLTLISYLSMNAAPIPWILQDNVKHLLLQQAKDGVGSNAFVNSIVFPCSHTPSGFVRGYDYGNALESYDRDLKNHLDKTEVFKVLPKDNLNIDKALGLCEFAIQFNTLKFNEVRKNEKS